MNMCTVISIAGHKPQGDLFTIDTSNLWPVISCVVNSCFVHLPIKLNFHFISFLWCNQMQECVHFISTFSRSLLIERNFYTQFKPTLWCVFIFALLFFFHSFCIRLLQPNQNAISK